MHKNTNPEEHMMTGSNKTPLPNRSPKAVKI